MKPLPLGLALSLLGSAASAQDVRLSPLIDGRVRWKSVDQADIASDAEALTARVRAGAKASAGPFELLVEAKGTLAIVERYNSVKTRLGSPHWTRAASKVCWF